MKSCLILTIVAFGLCAFSGCSESNLAGPDSGADSTNDGVAPLDTQVRADATARDRDTAGDAPELPLEPSPLSSCSEFDVVTSIEIDSRQSPVLSETAQGFLVVNEAPPFDGSHNGVPETAEGSPIYFVDGLGRTIEEHVPGFPWYSQRRVLVPFEEDRFILVASSSENRSGSAETHPIMLQALNSRGAPEGEPARFLPRDGAVLVAAERWGNEIRLAYTQHSSRTAQSADFSFEPGSAITLEDAGELAPEIAGLCPLCFDSVLVEGGVWFGGGLHLGWAEGDEQQIYLGPAPSTLHRDPRDGSSWGFVRLGLVKLDRESPTGFNLEQGFETELAEEPVAPKWANTPEGPYFVRGRRLHHLDQPALFRDLEDVVCDAADCSTWVRSLIYSTQLEGLVIGFESEGRLRLSCIGLGD